MLCLLNYSLPTPKKEVAPVLSRNAEVANQTAYIPLVYLQGRGGLGSFSGDHGAGVMKVKETAGGRAEQCCQDPG